MSLDFAPRPFAPDSPPPNPLAEEAFCDALLSAVTEDEPEALRALIISREDPHARLPQGSIEAFAAAARLGRLECLRLLAPVCDAAARERHFGDTPLRSAARAGRADCVRLLLPLSDPDPSDPTCPEALHLAASAGHLECVLALIPHCDPGRLCPWREEPPAVSALLSGHPDCFEALAPRTSFSALPTLDEGWNRDLLMLCAADPDLAHCLPAALPYSDLSRRDKRGFSALTWAAMSGSLPATRFLLDYFDPRELTPKGSSAMTIAERHADGLALAALREKASLLDEIDALAAAAARPGASSARKPGL